LVTQFGKALDRLAEFPHIGHERRDLTDKPVYFWPFFSYLIVYDPNARPIVVVRVLHASQDVRQTLKKTLVS
jgi:antitoxin ParD1/3/4/toxin ParE1/3/4